MTDQSILLPRLMARDAAIDRIARVLAALPTDKAYRLTIAEAKPNRSLPQNALLWAIYGQILERGGEAMRGWTKEELHEFMLGEWSGWEKISMFGRVKMRPIRRSSKLNKQDFTDLIAFIAQFMADQGVYLEMQEVA